MPVYQSDRSHTEQSQEFTNTSPSIEEGAIGEVYLLEECKYLL